MQTYYVNEKPINVIASSGSTPLNLQQKQLSITTNTTTPIRPDDGYQGLSDVIVTTNVQPRLAELNDTIQYGTSEMFPVPTGYDGFNPVTITATGPTYESKSVTIDHPQLLVVEPTNADFLEQVAIHATYPVLQEKNITITTNGVTTIAPDQNVTGISQANITVNVPYTQVTPSDEFHLSTINLSAINNNVLLNTNPTIWININNNYQLTKGTYVHIDQLGQIDRLYQTNEIPSITMNDGLWFIIMNSSSQIASPPTGLLTFITTENVNIQQELSSSSTINDLQFPQGYLTVLQINN